MDTSIALNPCYRGGSKTVEHEDKNQLPGIPHIHDFDYPCATITEKKTQQEARHQHDNKPGTGIQTQEELSWALTAIRSTNLLGVKNEPFSHRTAAVLKCGVRPTRALTQIQKKGGRSDIIMS